MYGIDKVIDEIKNRCWAKFDIDGVQNMIKSMKAPMPEEGMAVVEISAEPVEEEHKGEAEAPELPGWEEEKCPECDEAPCVCDDKKEDKEEDIEEWTDDMAAISDAKSEEVTPAEQDRMDEIIKAIKTFFPNENTEDVLVRIVSKLIDR